MTNTAALPVYGKKNDELWLILTARSNIGISSSVSVVHFDLEMQSALNSIGQGHLVTLPKGLFG